MEGDAGRVDANRFAIAEESTEGSSEESTDLQQLPRRLSYLPGSGRGAVLLEANPVRSGESKFRSF